MQLTVWGKRINTELRNHPILKILLPMSTKRIVCLSQTEKTSIIASISPRCFIVVITTFKLIKIIINKLIDRLKLLTIKATRFEIDIYIIKI